MLHSTPDTVEMVILQTPHTKELKIEDTPITQHLLDHQIQIVPNETFKKRGSPRSRNWFYSTSLHKNPNSKPCLIEDNAGV